MIKTFTPAFRPLLTGVVLSTLGDSLFVIMFTWLALSLTGSTAVMGNVIAIQAFPLLLLGPLAGVLVDRFAKRKLMAVSATARAAIALGLAFLLGTNGLGVPHLYATALLVSGLSIFFMPSVRILMTRSVEDKLLPKANSTLQGSQQLTQIVGASLAGILIGLFGIQSVAVLAAVLFASASIISLTWVREHAPEGQAEAKQPGSKGSGVGQQLVAGLRYIVGTREILFLTILLFVLNLSLSPVNVIFPVFSLNLGAGPEGFGFLAAAIAGGMLCGTVIAGSVGDRLSYVSMLALGLGLMSAALAGLSLANTLLIAIAGVAFLGSTAPLVQIPLVTRLQRTVPPDYQGRVFTTLGTLTQAALPLSAALAGQALQLIEVSLIFAGVSATMLVLMLSWLLLQGIQRRQEPSVEVAASEDAPTK